MSGGTISGNTASYSNGHGGGVHVYDGTFIKTGQSVIYGDTDTTHTPGSTENTAKSGKGHAVAAGSKKRNTTAGTGVNLDSTTSANWE
jgi:hypothetical protein